MAQNSRTDANLRWIPDPASFKRGGVYMYAIVKTGGKQYKVSEGDVLFVEKLEANEGDVVTLNEVLAVNDGELKLGTPVVEGANVQAKVLEQGKDKKIIVYKYKAKKDYRRKNGHRQLYTKLVVEKINA